ncbi:MAG: peptidylprolyl isomerase, partial [Bacilli bacterium]
QFFIMHQDYPSLDGSYAAFGHVTEGMEVVDKIVVNAKPTDDNGTINYEEQPIIETIKIID